MNSKEIERYEATRLREEIVAEIEKMKDVEVIRYAHIFKNYKNIHEFLDFIKGLK